MYGPRCLVRLCSEHQTSSHSLGKPLTREDLRRTATLMVRSPGLKRPNIRFFPCAASLLWEYRIAMAVTRCSRSWQRNLPLDDRSKWLDSAAAAQSPLTSRARRGFRLLVKSSPDLERYCNERGRWASVPR